MYSVAVSINQCNVTAILYVQLIGTKCIKRDFCTENIQHYILDLRSHMHICKLEVLNFKRKHI
jgi:hypothetical protein